MFSEPLVSFDLLCVLVLRLLSDEHVTRTRGQVMSWHGWSVEAASPDELLQGDRASSGLYVMAYAPLLAFDLPLSRVRPHRTGPSHGMSLSEREEVVGVSVMDVS